ncbi:MAG: 1,2-phenylacetyl-CoA epoxidase subunit PaaD [Candidatus Neomarinimicrobiota bacterium]|nr:1,2-phenylacetyl-CoA epoxidase subunit PaaD [Candidatus Neomarinimicrobiota bacterium]
MKMETNKIWGMLENIPDPEIPNVSIVEMGIVRGIEYNHDTLNVIITPTYSGCPAIDLIKREIKQNLIMKGINDFEITTSLFPPWTTEWLNEETKNKLKSIGIAPPEKKIECPYCNSDEVKVISEFGSTACKAFYKCIHCIETFEYFKCI